MKKCKERGYYSIIEKYEESRTTLSIIKIIGITYNYIIRRSCFVYNGITYGVDNSYQLHSYADPYYHDFIECSEFYNLCNLNIGNKSNIDKEKFIKIVTEESKLILDINHKLMFDKILEDEKM